MEKPTHEQVIRGHEIARELITLRVYAKAGGHAAGDMASLRSGIVEATSEMESDPALLMATLGALASLAAVSVDILAQVDKCDVVQLWTAIATRAVTTDFTF